MNEGSNESNCSKRSEVTGRYISLRGDIANDNFGT